MAGRASSTIYVGNLPLDVKEWEIEDLFCKYGPVIDVELKLPPRPPGYSFVEFGDPREAQEAIRGRDGYNFDGCLLRVELAQGGRDRSPVSRHGGRGGGGRGVGGSRGDGGGGRGGGGGGGRGVSRRTEFRVIVRGLPPSASWQDLKDYMRKAGDVCFTQVFRDGDGMTGVVDYTNYDDMEYAIRKLDDTEFRNPFSRSYIRIRAYEGSPPRARSRSRSPARGRSRSPRFASRFPPHVKAGRSRSRSASPHGPH